MAIVNLKTLAASGCFLLAASCSSTPPKPTTPELTPGVAAQLLANDDRAQTWLKHVKKQNTSCEFVLSLPDQNPRLTQIDLDHVILCQGQAAPRELDASVTFVYDPDAQKWLLKRFSS